MHLPQIENPSSVLKITTLNAEWLGCSENGPKDKSLQIRNVARAIEMMDCDIIALQEVAQSANYAAIDTLVALLGNEYGGNIFPYSTEDCGQNQGVIFKKSKVEFTSSMLLNNGP